MLLGTPCISSDVGGVNDMLRRDEEGFVYPYDEYYMLAYYIKYVFDCKKRIASVTKKAQEHARITHDPMINSNGVMDIYKEIIKQ